MQYRQHHDGALLDHISAAMTALLDLEDNDAEQLNEALLHHAGNGVAKLLPEDGALDA